MRRWMMNGRIRTFNPRRGEAARWTQWCGDVLQQCTYQRYQNPNAVIYFREHNKPKQQMNKYEVVHHCVVPTCTVMFRNKVISIPAWFVKQVLVFILFYLLSKKAICIIWMSRLPYTIIITAAWAVKRPSMKCFIPDVAELRTGSLFRRGRWNEQGGDWKHQCH